MLQKIHMLTFPEIRDRFVYKIRFGSNEFMCQLNCAVYCTNYVHLHSTILYEINLKIIRNNSQERIKII